MQVSTRILPPGERVERGDQAPARRQPLFGRRQLYYSEKSNKSLDLALFLNGIPIFTAELKNPLTGQTIEDAIRQYRTNRDPRERCSHLGVASRTLPSTRSSST